MILPAGGGAARAGHVPGRRVVGLLLAAGKGRRFDASGRCNKLLQPLEEGTPVAVAAARHLRSVVETVLAVVPPGQEALACALQAAGCRTLACAEADQGMGATLTFGLRALPPADGVLVALADMPFVRPSTLARLVWTFAAQGGIVAPVHGGRRGNPVVFDARHLPQLLQLHGDEGARGLLRTLPVHEVHVPDEGVLRDVDRPGDLAFRPAKKPDGGFRSRC